MVFNQIFINFIFFLILILINYSSSQIIINPLNFGNSGPTIITRQTFTVRANDGTPVTITKINVHSGRNINGGNGRLTPFDLMRLADSRMNEFFEAIISRQIQIFNEMEQEEENSEKENNKETENNNENNNKNDQTNNTVDDKEFELDENDDKNKNDDNNNDIKNDKKNDEKNENKEEGEKDSNDKKNNKNKNTKKIGKLTINEDNIKKANKNNKKKKGKKLTKKEIIFSRVCKYIFYSIILFTFYILIKKLLEILEIIDPENPGKNVDVNISNTKGNNEEKKEKVENEVIVNKERENEL
jgi:hypothetical protein